MNLVLLGHQIVHRQGDRAVVDLDHEARRLANIITQLIDVGAEVCTVALEHDGGVVENFLELADLTVELALFGGEAGIERVDVAA